MDACAKEGKVYIRRIFINDNLLTLKTRFHIAGSIGLIRALDQVSTMCTQNRYHDSISSGVLAPTNILVNDNDFPSKSHASRSISLFD